MNNLRTLIIILLLNTSCRSGTKFGECVGLDEDTRNPELVYKLDTQNMFWSIIALETVIAPVLWATSYAYCPVAKRELK